jgi:GDP-4-dehydro-6-deoxy-D-mannose reductase
VVRSIAITGVDGFVGRHLAAAASARGFEVVGVGRIPLLSNDPLNDLLTGYESGDLTKSVPRIPQTDAMVHLAGLSSVGPSFGAPNRYIRENTAMLINICEFLLSNSNDTTRTIVVSSGAVYAPAVTSIDESSKLGASSPYVVSKRAVEVFAEYYKSRGLDVVVARPFNHIGPGQRDGFIVPDLYARLIKHDRSRPLAVNSLASYRDYTDVRDVAEAYLDLCFTPALGALTYNVSSGSTKSGVQVLDEICRALAIDVPILAASGNHRPNDSSTVVGSSAALRRDTGWVPSITFSQSVSDFVAFRMALDNV